MSVYFSPQTTEIMPACELLVQRQGMPVPTIFLMHLLNLINIFPLQPKIVIKLIPMCSGRDLRAREACQRREIQPVDHQPNSMYNI
jgi:hypothetical protein